MTSFKNKLNQFLFKRIDADIVALFRIILGCILLSDMFYFLKNNFVFQCITGPELLFKYPYFEFIQPLSNGIMNTIQTGLIISSVLIILGLFYRWAMAFFFLGFTFFLLQDTTLYNNHLYLFSLVTFLMIFIDADAKYSIKSIFKKKDQSNQERLIPNWNLWILRFQVMVVYFFGGIAKFTSDWINGNVTTVVLNNADVPAMLQTPEGAKFVAFFGLIFDLFLPFLLLFKRTRLIGILIVLAFNLTNHFFFFNDIGIFPIFMILATFLFFEPGSVNAIKEKIFGKELQGRKAKKKVKKDRPKKEVIPEMNWKTSLTSTLLIGYVVIQVLLPLRHYVMTNNPDWTGIAARFAWRMKMQTFKPDTVKMKVVNPSSGNEAEIDVKSYLTINQQNHFFDDPRNVVQLAKYVKQKANNQGFPNAIINSEIKVMFNGRNAQYLIYPDVDLSQIDERSNEVSHWVYPLED